ncbi:MAG: gamma-glutamyltransferase, partial [Pseudomonadota bacterium]
PLPEGAVYYNPDFADVLETYGREGPRFVMEGEVGAALIDIAREGGHLSSEDLCAYEPVWRSPLAIRRGSFEIALNPAPSLGGTLIALSLELTGSVSGPVDLARVFQAVSACRAEAADDPVRLAAPDLVDHYRATLSRHAVSTRGTTQISVVDVDGNAVSLTLSNGEGCGLIVPGTGIMPNNMLGEEDLVPGDWQSWPCDARLASMMCPLVARSRDGALLVMGSGGSNRIRTALSQVLLGIIDAGLDLEAAIHAPRLHIEEGRLDFERAGLAEETVQELMEAFPDAVAWPEASMFFGGVHAVSRTPKGDVFGVGDPRRAGVALPAAHYVAG